MRLIQPTADMAGSTVSCALTSLMSPLVEKREVRSLIASTPTVHQIVRLLIASTAVDSHTHRAVGDRQRHGLANWSGQLSPSWFNREVKRSVIAMEIYDELQRSTIAQVRLLEHIAYTLSGRRSLT